jgi:hypothetical protein
MKFKMLSFAVVLVFSIGLMGCSEDHDRLDETAVQFSYSVLTSSNGKGLDLLAELNYSVLPKLKKEGAQEYAIWSKAPDSSSTFAEIADDKLVVMLRWKKIETTRLAEELESMTGVSNVMTSLWEASLRGGEGPLEVDSGFYIHRFNRYLNDDTNHVLSLNEQAWVTWEPFWEAKVLGVWRELNAVDESNGITRLVRIAWYRDMEHWQETREFWRDPDSFEIFVERAELQLDDDTWSAILQPR